MTLSPQGLQLLRDKITGDEAAFVSCFLSFKEIRDKVLWIETHPTFDAFCSQWDMTEEYVNDAIEIADQLSSTKN